MSEERQRGVDLFNATWRLIESRDDDDLMLHMAHASGFHWAAAPECTPANRARSEWLVSRVSALCDLPDAVLRHARSCLRWCEENGLGDWDLAFAYEALARASKAAGDNEAANRYLERAAAVPIEEADDRELLERDLATI